MLSFSRSFLMMSGFCVTLPKNKAPKTTFGGTNFRLVQELAFPEILEDNWVFKGKDM